MCDFAMRLNWLHTIVLSVLLGLVPIAHAQKEIAMPTPKGNLTLLFGGFLKQDDWGGVRLQAAIRNDTPFTFESVMFAMYGYDANGQDVWLCGSHGISSDGGCGFFLFEAIEPGQTVAIKGPGDFVVLNRMSVEPARTEFTIRDARYVIRYNINVAPVDNQRFAITSHLSPTGIAVELRNKSSEVIEVAWDQSVYIDEDGNSSRLIRGGVNLSEKDRPQPSTVIPPGTKVQETVFPVSRIEQQEGQLSQRPIIPAEAWIIGDQKRLQELRADRLRRMYLPGDKELAGKSVRLFLRLLVGDKKENVTLTFDIAGMAQ